MKATFYFPHDYNARGDEKIIPLLRAMGPEGYGLYWLVVEKLYEAAGKLGRDYETIAWDLKTDAAKIKRVVEGFGLFYIVKKRIGSKSVDRRLAERAERSQIARQKGIASGQARRNSSAPDEPQLNRSSTDAQLERKERKERKKEITTAPLAVDYSGYRLNVGKYQHVHVINVPVDECQFLLKNTPRLGREERAALEWRINQKLLDMTPEQRKAHGAVAG